jgi:hypothetical protein
VSSAVSSSISGISTHSQDGDRIENPSNTGCSTHGDFSAPVVSEPGTAGDSPAAITRISSGITAAIPRHAADSTSTAALPAHPQGVWGGSFPPRQTWANEASMIECDLVARSSRPASSRPR